MNTRHVMTHALRRGLLGGALMFLLAWVLLPGHAARAGQDGVVPRGRGSMTLSMIRESGVAAGQAQPGVQLGAAARLSLLPRAAQGAGPGAAMPDWRGVLPHAGLALATLPLLLWVLRRRDTVNEITQPGFEVISPSERRSFIPLEERYQAMDFVSKIPTRGSLRLSANLNKVTLSIRRFGYLMEDKNYRNALLVNRRRVRRTLLRNGDVLDLGDLTLLYRDHREPQVIRHASVTPAEGKSQIKFDRPKGPISKGSGMLTSDQTPNRPFYLTKNLNYIGRSEDNDLVIKSRAVYFRHAKIEKVGGRYKLKDLSILGNTFVNNRRIEQRYLKDGDEISIEMHRFKFHLVTRPTREHLPPGAQSQGGKPRTEEQDASLDDMGEAMEEMDGGQAS